MQRRSTNVGGWCDGGTQTDNKVYVEVRDLRIVVTMARPGRP